MLSLKGRDCVGGSPNSLRSIDYSIEFDILGGRLKLNTAVDPALVRDIGFARHPQGMDHPLVSVRRPPGAVGAWSSAETVARGTACPRTIAGALQVDGAAEPTFDLVTLPRQALLAYEYLEHLSRFAAAAKRDARAGRVEAVRGGDVRGDVLAARVAAWGLVDVPAEVAEAEARTHIAQALEASWTNPEEERRLEREEQRMLEEEAAEEAAQAALAAVIEGDDEEEEE